VTTFLYDKVGNRQSVTRANAAGVMFSTTIYTYDLLNRLTDITNLNGSNGLVSKSHYGLRADGKRQSVTETGQATSGGTTNYTYDDQGKLTQEAGPYATIAYGYDNVGNRLTKTVTGAAASTPATLANGITLVNGTTSYAYDNNDRITSQTGTALAVTHTYDADGNETTVNGQTALYDFENHLVSLGSVASYVYDADGNRVSVTGPSANGTVTTNYVVDPSLPYASVIEEYAGSSTTPSARYDYGDDLVRMDRSSGVYYYIYDGLGSTRQLVNTSGTVTDSYGYSAFGEMAAHTGNTVNPFLFNAQQFDGASGDYYLRARYYDQSNGRFISQDPFGGRNADPVSLHRYLYTSDDPSNRVDPGGKDDLPETIEATTEETGLGAKEGAVQAQVSRTILSQIYGAAFRSLQYSALRSLGSAATTAAVGIGVDAFYLQQLKQTSQGSDLVYHYTDKKSAEEIQRTGEMKTTDNYRGTQYTFPPGAYATDIAPFDSEWLDGAAPTAATKSNLSAYFKGGLVDIDKVSWYVAIDITEDSFRRLEYPGIDHFYIKDGPQGGTVPVTVSSIGFNPMPDR